MIGSLEVTHELIFTIPSVIQISLISPINSIWLRFNLGKPLMITRVMITVAPFRFFTIDQSNWQI